ncbi:hypothetical protein DS843_06685 [Roseomonas genomospecies 6]|uniref:Uncharacterized protein n=1 Tax=Roseomonas genomospecies 6 TaxID=214106 RepID=A0A9W7TZ78_9PROT|nr:hypothetical protein DS843_06685 [Roseomonas genomospecies 6]
MNTGTFPQSLAGSFRQGVSPRTGPLPNPPPPSAREGTPLRALQSPPPRSGGGSGWGPKATTHQEGSPPVAE